MFSSEIPVLLANVLKLVCNRVQDLDIAGQIPVAVNLGELVEMLICNGGNIELMVADCQEIVVNVFKDGVGD